MVKCSQLQDFLFFFILCNVHLTDYVQTHHFIISCKYPDVFTVSEHKYKKCERLRAYSVRR